jgi:DnaJ family protein C protein 25
LTDDHISCVPDEFTKEDLVMKRLWEKANMERHMAEARKGSKRRR